LLYDIDRSYCCSVYISQGVYRQTKPFRHHPSQEYTTSRRAYPKKHSFAIQNWFTPANRNKKAVDLNPQSAITKEYNRARQAKLVPFQGILTQCELMVTLIKITNNELETEPSFIAAKHTNPQDCNHPNMTRIK
jgi:hypothetical protein